MGRTRSRATRVQGVTLGKESFTYSIHATFMVLTHKESDHMVAVFIRVRLHRRELKLNKQREQSNSYLIKARKRNETRETSKVE